MTKQEQVALWEAINRYAEACGADTSASSVSAERMRAVVLVERAVSSIETRWAADMREVTEAAEETATEVRRALGEAWLAGGVSLAEGIRRKTAALERLARGDER